MQNFTEQATRNWSPFPVRNMKNFKRRVHRVSALEKHVDILLEALRLARHKQFGASSEKCDETLTEQLSFLFNEAEVFAQPKKEEVTAVAAHTRHKKHEYTLDNIPEGMPHGGGRTPSGG